MNRSIYHRTSLVAVSVLTLVVFLGCFCWPSLPSLVHQGSCAPIQAAQSANGKAGAIPPPRPKIVYIHAGDIWIMNADGKESTQLTKTTEAEFSLSFAQYPEKIWFIKETGVAGSTPYGDVYSCDLAGKNVAHITDGLKVGFAVVSNDGKKLAASIVKQVPDLNAGGQPGDTADMWILSAEKQKQTGSEDYVDLTSNLPYTLGLGRYGSTFAAWSPTSDTLAFTYKSDGSASLGISTRAVYTAAADGTSRIEIIKSADEPGFDGQGERIVAVNGAHWDTMGVIQTKADGTSPEVVLPIAPGSDVSTTLYSVYTPFWMNTYEDITTQVNIFYAKTTHPAPPGEPVNTLERFDTQKKTTSVVATQNGADKTITHASGENYKNLIAFQVGRSDSSGGGNASIWTVKPDGTGLTQLTQGTDDSEPIWAEDNSWWRGEGGTAKANKCHWPYQNKTIQF
ncbi:MAG: hypothetical protein WC891_04255 [Actinomycetota bacterium]